MKRHILFAANVLLPLTVFIPSATAQAPARQKVTICYPTRASQAWPLYVAKEGGYYEKYGMDVTLQFGVHPFCVAELVSEDAVMTPYTLEQSMQAAFRDGSLIGIGAPYKKS